jgi:hypothetical protein
MIRIPSGSRPDPVRIPSGSRPDPVRIPSGHEGDPTADVTVGTDAQTPQRLLQVGQLVRAVDRPDQALKTDAARVVRGSRPSLDQVDLEAFWTDQERRVGVVDDRRARQEPAVELD